MGMINVVRITYGPHRNHRICNGTSRIPLRKNACFA